MTTIESKSVEINSSQKKVFDFLSNFNNFEKIVPLDKIKNWQSTEDSCSFEISGLASIGMKIETLSPSNSIQITSFGKNPFDFKLDIQIQELNSEKSKTQIIFNGKINPFVKMMVEKPLGNFFNTLIDKLEEINR